MDFFTLEISSNFRWTNDSNGSKGSERKGIIQADKKSFELLKKEITLNKTK